MGALLSREVMKKERSRVGNRLPCGFRRRAQSTAMARKASGISKPACPCRRALISKLRSSSCASASVSKKRRLR